MKKFFLPSFILLGVFSLFLFLFRLPASDRITLTLPKPQNEILLVPLDSRPVCGEMVQELGKLGGINVILPPKELLDNYKKPADTNGLYQWLANKLPLADRAVISADLLLHGGLLHGRQSKMTVEAQTRALEKLQDLLQQNASKDIAVFSIIPRLLVSDEILPDRWYKYQLWRYSRFFDMAEIFNDYLVTEELLDSVSRIPSEILFKYAGLYQNNYSLNKRLLENALPGHTVVIGQDDGAPFGLPHRSARQTEQLIESSGRNDLFITYGADELAVLLLTRLYLLQHNYRPKVFLCYADPPSEFLHMPYLPASVGAVLRSQLHILKLEETLSPNEADIICYISCGHDRYKPSLRQVEELQHLLNKGRPLAVLDLSANFTEDELLLPLLLQENFPLARLAAFSGWNTFSNSSGSLLAQAVIFSGQTKMLPPEDQPALYSENLRFTCKRLLEDHFYQKIYHPNLKTALLNAKINPAELSLEEKITVERYLQTKAAWQCEKLLYDNLGRTAFYSQNGSEYYLRCLRAGILLPWNRIFEAKLLIHTEIGVKTAVE